MLKAHNHTRSIMQKFRVFEKYLRAHAGLLVIDARNSGANMITCPIDCLSLDGLLSVLSSFGAK